MDDIIEYLSNLLGEINIKKLIFPTIIIILFIGSFTYLFYTIKNIEKNNNNIESNIIKESSTTKEVKEYIYVDVKGEVANPGVYKLNNNSRVIDAVEASGGITDKANTRFINLSKLLEDGDVVVVYSNTEIETAKKENIVYVETPCVCEEVKNDACYNEEKEEEKKEEQKDKNQNNTNTKININTASIDELKTIDGIGDAKASAIIEYRQKNGNFKSIEDIINVSGISETLFSKIKENITV